MGSSLVEIHGILFEKTVELPLLQDQEVIQAFSPHTPQKAFANGIGLRGAIRGSKLYWLLSTSVREKGHLAMIPILFLSVRWDSAIDRGGESFSFTRETTGV